MPFIPVYDFLPTTIGKAFLLNAFILAFIAALSIEGRWRLEQIEETKNLPYYKKLVIVIIGTFIISIIIYFFARIIFGFGGGMLTSQKIKTLL